MFLILRKINVYCHLELFTRVDKSGGIDKANALHLCHFKCKWNQNISF